MRIPLSDPKPVLEASWMSDPDLVRRLDSDVRQRLVAARAPATLPGRQPPHSVDVLVAHVHRGVRYRRWFVASAACALLGELIYASERGGLYKVKTQSRNERDRLHRPLEILRNACFHPALVVDKGGKGAAVERLVEAIRKMSEFQPLAQQLASNWARLHDAALAAWAIRQLHHAGRYEIDPKRRSQDRR